MENETESEESRKIDSRWIKHKQDLSDEGPRLDLTHRAEESRSDVHDPPASAYLRVCLVADRSTRQHMILSCVQISGIGQVCVQRSQKR